MNKKSKVLMLIAVIVTSISTGYSLESTTTTVQGKPVSLKPEQTLPLNPENVTDLLTEDGDSASHSLTTTQTIKFHIEFKGVESMLNQITRIIGVEHTNDTN